MTSTEAATEAATVSYDLFIEGETHVYRAGEFAGRIYHGGNRSHVTAVLGKPDTWGGPIIGGRVREFGQPLEGGINLLAEAKAWIEQEIESEIESARQRGRIVDAQAFSRSHSASRLLREMLARGGDATADDWYAACDRREQHLKETIVGILHGAGHIERVWRDPRVWYRVTRAGEQASQSDGVWPYRRWWPADGEHDRESGETVETGKTGKTGQT